MVALEEEVDGGDVRRHQVPPRRLRVERLLGVDAERGVTRGLAGVVGGAPQRALRHPFLVLPAGHGCSLCLRPPGGRGLF